MKIVKRVLSKLRQTPFKFRKDFLILMVSIFFILLVSQIYLLLEQESVFTKNQTKSQLNYAYDNIKNKFDLAHMHIALDYNVTQTIFDSADTLKIPSTMGMCLQNKYGHVIYETGDISDIPDQEFIAVSKGDLLFVRVPIFTHISEYSFTIKLRNIYKSSVEFLAGDANPRINVALSSIEPYLILNALNRASLFSLIILLGMIIWLICVNFGSVLHDQGQFKYLYRILAAEIDQLAVSTNVENQINKATKIIDFVSTFDRESASETTSNDTIELVGFLETLYEAYKFNFENMKFYSNYKDFITQINKDALASVVTNLLHNSVMYVSKLAPSLAPEIIINLTIGPDFIVIEIGNTFKKSYVPTSHGLGTRSMVDICSDNSWKIYKKPRKDMFVCILKIPRR